MTLSTRTKFLAISLTITSIALIIFTDVIYDKAIIYKHSIERQSYDTLSRQLQHQLQDHTDLPAIRSILKHHINSADHPVTALQLQIQGETILSMAKKDFSESKNIFQTVSPGVDSGISTLENTNNSYYWKRLLFNNSSINKPELFIIYPLSSSAYSETIKFFGVPLFVAGFLLLWAMVWASIILSSLVNKLEKQKQTLSTQADDVKKARDEALQANNTKSRFLANMSHEIRTPLTSIIGFAESCQDNTQTIKEKETAIRTIIRSGNHLLNIINDILDISKIEAGKLEIESHPVNVFETLSEIEMFINILATEKGLVYKHQFNFPLPETIYTDPLRLKQILLNLLANAIKFTEKGQVKLDISFDETSNELKFDVIDSGIGMPEEFLENIFDAFQQADTSITRQYGGTGLGLSLSRQLSQLLHGDIYVESTVDVGSTFSFILNLKPEAELKMVSAIDESFETEKPALPNSALPNVNGKILVAEDNTDIQALIKMYISKIGAELTLVNNGLEAVNKINESDFDLILLDIQMPIMDGLEALKQIRKSGFNKPVIAMTANTMKQDQDNCFKAGFDEFISKPIDRNELYTTILNYIETEELSNASRAFITSSILQDEPQVLELVDNFLERLPVMSKELQNYYDEKNWDAFKKLIHQLKGLGGGFGYSLITKISEKIELSLKDDDLNQVSILLNDLHTVTKQAIAGKDENHKIVKSI